MRFYFSVGDRESKTKNPRMATVEDCTRAAAELFRSRGANVKFELNPGGHFEIETQIMKIVMKEHYMYQIQKIQKKI